MAWILFAVIAAVTFLQWKLQKVGVLLMRLVARPRSTCDVAVRGGFLAPLVWMISASLRPEAKVLSVPPQFLPATRSGTTTGRSSS